MTLFTFILTLLFTTAHAQGKWEFYAYDGLPGMLSFGRLDPIISPGQVSSHVHQIQGGSAMAATYDYDSLRKSTCSTVRVQEDLSNYWSPALYHYDGSQYTLMLGRFSIYYQHLTYSYDPNNPKGSSKRYAFPKGLTMLAGDMMQRSVDPTDPNSRASVFQCQRSGDEGGGPYSHDMRDFQKEGKNCDNLLRATTRFPSCWDGNPDNSDRTHVVYPDSNQVCPQSHPKALMQLTFEWYWPVQDFPFDPKREDNWVFSYGDTSGFGFHGDFANGWNEDLLQQAIDECNVAELGIEHCKPFALYQTGTIPPCMPTGQYPDEEVGLNGALHALPGCNPLWTDNSTKPTCDTGNHISSTKNLAVAEDSVSITKTLGPDLSNWNYLSCPLIYQNNGRILKEHSKTDWEDMTVDSCLAECKGYKYAMLDSGKNCYCDNEIQNGASTLSDPNYGCQVRCKGNYLEFCGGFGSGQLYEACSGTSCHNSSPSPNVQTPAPSSGNQADVSTSTGASSTASSTDNIQTPSPSGNDQPGVETNTKASSSTTPLVKIQTPSPPSDEVSKTDTPMGAGSTPPPSTTTTEFHTQSGFITVATRLITRTITACECTSV